MQIVVPHLIDDAKVVSSTIAEPATTGGPAAWAAGTSYDRGQIVVKNSKMFVSVVPSNMGYDPIINTSPARWAHIGYYPEPAAYNAATAYALYDDATVNTATMMCTKGHKVFKSMAATNTGNDPELVASVKWQEVFSSQKWSMFDQYVNTASYSTSDITVVLNSNGADSLYLFNVSGSDVTVTLKDAGGTVVSTETKTLSADDLFIVDWYEYFYGQFTRRTDLGFHFPIYQVGTITVTVTPISGCCSIGSIVLGRKMNVGATKFDCKISLLDWSRKTTDDFGRTYLAQGKSAKKMEASFYVENPLVDTIRRRLDAVRGIPCVFDGNNPDLSNHDSLVVYGYFADFGITIEGPEMSGGYIDVRGLI